MSAFARTREAGKVGTMLTAPHTANPTPVQDCGAAADGEHQARELQRLQGDLKFANTQIAALKFEVARLKHWRFGASSESTSTQAVLFDLIVADTRAEDAAASEEEAPAKSRPAAVKGQAVRAPLPAHLPRIDHHHELESAVCECGAALKRIGQEVSEQLDCVPAQFFVHRHIRGKWACACCQTMAAAPMPAQIIDKGIPAPGLLAQVVIAKHDDHLPLYRQEEIYARSGAELGHKVPLRALCA